MESTDVAAVVTKTLDISSILFWAGSGGALGGTAEYLRQIVYRDNVLRTNGSELSLGPGILLLLCSATIGTSGAIAFQFVLISLKWFSASNNPVDILFLFSISVAAGFGARNLLPQITERLRDQVKNLRAQQDEFSKETRLAIEQAEAATTQAREATREAHNTMIVTRVLVALEPGSIDSDKKRCIEYLTTALEKEPKNRVFVIYAGRLYRALKDYATAISVLDRFLILKKQEKEHDTDYADVLYNKACYYALLLEETAEETKKEEYKKMALESLSTSINISPENKADAKLDRDFETLAGEQFRQLVED